jgi:glycosyltransferase involved in cell wall biosynthesis
MDLYPDILPKAGWLAEDSRAYRLLAGLSLRALRNAAGIVVIGRCMEERLIGKGIDPAKIHFIPTSAPQQVRPMAHRHNRFRQRFGLQDKFVVMYSGNMGLLHDFDTLLSVARSLADHPEIRFLFVGNGRRRASVEAAIASGARNVKLIDYQKDGEELAHSLSAADVHFISLRAGCEGLVVPSKFYGAIAAGRPVIYEGAAAGEVARVIHASGCGMVVRPGDAAELRTAILSLYADQEQRRQLGAIALDVHRRHYEPVKVADAYCRAVAESLAAATEIADGPAEPQLGM